MARVPRQESHLPPLAVKHCRRLGQSDDSTLWALETSRLARDRSHLLRRQSGRVAARSSPRLTQGPERAAILPLQDRRASRAHAAAQFLLRISQARIAILRRHCKRIACHEDLLSIPATVGRGASRRHREAIACCGRQEAGSTGNTSWSKAGRQLAYRPGGRLGSMA